MSSKKASEGIALLSMYNDEEEDDEMEDVVEESLQLGEGLEKDPQQVQDDYMGDAADETRVSSDRGVVSDSGNDRSPPHLSTDSDTQSHKPQLEDFAAVEVKRLRTDRLTIVDYGHDELAMSPEPEEGDFGKRGQVMFGRRLQSMTVEHQENAPSETVQILSPGVITPHSEHQEQSQTENPSHDSLESGDGGGEHAIEGDDDVNPLDKFLQPAPKAKCSEELQEKVRKFIAYKRAGKSFNAEVRNRKDYRNPDFLLHAVTYQGIDQTGSCFRKEVFDPHGFDQSDYYDEIEADMKREGERKEVERKRNQQMDFVSSGTQPGTIPIMPKINVVPNVVRPVPSGADVGAREGRQNKKSKWDKVDAEGPDSSTAGSHAAAAAVLSGSNAGAGYMAFAQQKRREVEEKRKTDRRS